MYILMSYMYIYLFLYIYVGMSFEKCDHATGRFLHPNAMHELKLARLYNNLVSSVLLDCSTELRDQTVAGLKRLPYLDDCIVHSRMPYGTFLRQILSLICIIYIYIFIMINTPRHFMSLAST